MSKLTKNLPIEIPKNVSIDGRGYVRKNVSNCRKNGHPDHEKILIGKVVDPFNWKEDRRMYPNDRYFSYFNKEREDAESFTLLNSLNIGVYAVVKKLAEESGVIKILSKIFNKADTNLILDLALYILADENAEFQHFSDWARGNAIFSDIIRSSSYISEFLQKIEFAKIETFRYDWAEHSIGRGKIFLSYDSTNVNSQAEDAQLVQHGHAKDNNKLPQVNTDYVITQEDGTPVTFMNFPGSVGDVVEAPRMIEFLQEVSKNDTSLKLDITVVVDRAYPSEENIKKMDDANVGFLCILPENAKDKIEERMISTHSKKVKSIVNYVKASDQYAKTFDAEWLGRTRYFHIIWDADLEETHRLQLIKKIDEQEQELKSIVIKHTRLTQKEYDNYSQYLVLDTDKYVQEKPGRGKSKNLYAVKPVISKKVPEIDKALSECGFFVIVTSQKMEAVEALNAYTKRDGIEKMFRALKSNMGMDKIGVHSDESIRSKTMIWFISSIFYSMLFNKVEPLRRENRTDFTIPSIIRKLNNIRVDKKNTNYYVRSDVFDKQQNQILEALKISLKEIDEDGRRISCP